MDLTQECCTNSHLRHVLIGINRSTCELLAFSGHALCLWAQDDQTQKGRQHVLQCQGHSPALHSASWWLPFPACWIHAVPGPPFLHMPIWDMAVSQCLSWELFIQVRKCFLGFP